MFERIAHLKPSLRRLGERRLAESGAVSTEFALLLTLVALAVIAASVALGLAVAHLFDTGTAGIPNG
jgi:Flp pilus assembly pilin Flp